MVGRRNEAVVDPQALERIRAARASEDAAVAEMFHHVGLVESAQRRRAEALRAFDADVRHAEEALAEARGALVTIAGLPCSASPPRRCASYSLPAGTAACQNLPATTR